MRKSTVLYTAFFLALLLAGLHFLAGAFYLYWVYWWYDVLMHFLAGVVGGFAAYWVLFKSGHFYSDTQVRVWVLILAVFVCVLIAGVAWEVFEYVNGITDSHEGYRVDVINDLILDSAGGVLAALLSLRKRHSHNLT